MFVLSKAVSYFWPVSVEVPVDGGKFLKQTFEAEFKRIPASRVKEVMTTDTGEIDSVMFSKEIVIGWKGVMAHDGTDLPFSPSNLEELLEIPQVGNMIVKAYFASVTGAPRKN